MALATGDKLYRGLSKNNPDSIKLIAHFQSNRTANEKEDILKDDETLKLVWQKGDNGRMTSRSYTRPTVAKLFKRWKATVSPVSSVVRTTTSAELAAALDGEIDDTTSLLETALSTHPAVHQRR